MIRILHIRNEAGDPPISGADWRNHSIGVALARIGQVENMAAGPLLDGAARTARRASFVRAIPQDVCAFVAARARAVAPDITVIDGVGLLMLAEHLARDGIGGALVFNTHNVESALLAENDIARTPAPLRPLARLWFQPRWRRARAAERAMADMSAGMLVCSADDLSRLAAIAPGARIAVAPNAVPAWNPEAGEAGPAERGRTPKAVFVGHLGYRPNRLAAKRLLGAIWPLVRRGRADAELVVAGRAPKADLHRLAAQCAGARLAPDPVDLDDIYRGAALAIMPIDQGGGTRLKALEALCRGVPVAATAKAVEGLGFVDGVHYLRAESDAAFAAAAGRLFDDAALAARLAAAGRAHVEAHFSQRNVDAAVAAAIARFAPELLR